MPVFSRARRSLIAAGTYTVRLTASDGTASATSDVTVTVTQGSGGGAANVFDKWMFRDWWRHLKNR